jgi:hypothetical protein
VGWCPCCPPAPPPPAADAIGPGLPAACRWGRVRGRVRSRAMAGPCLDSGPPRLGEQKKGRRNQKTQHPRPSERQGTTLPCHSGPGKPRSHHRDPHQTKIARWRAGGSESKPECARLLLGPMPIPTELAAAPSRRGCRSSTLCTWYISGMRTGTGSRTAVRRAMWWEHLQCLCSRARRPCPLTFGGGACFLLASFGQ